MEESVTQAKEQDHVHLETYRVEQLCCCLFLGLVVQQWSQVSVEACCDL